MRRILFGWAILAALACLGPARATASGCIDGVLGGCGLGLCGDSGNNNCKCNECCPRGGWIGGAELTLLTAHTGGLGINIPALNTGDFQVTPEYDPEVSVRLWLGYEGPGGMQFRTRWWRYDHDATGTDLFGAPLPDIDLPVIDLPGAIPFDLISQLNAETLDFEVADSQSFCNWNFEIAAGVRIGDIKETFRLEAPGERVDLSRDFEGVGPTVALTALRPIGCSGLSLLGSFRASMLYGDSNLMIDGLNGGASLYANQHLMEIYDLQIGGRWTRDVGRGRLFTQVAYEAQAWELAPFALGLLDSNIGFVGASFAIGIER